MAPFGSVDGFSVGGANISIRFGVSRNGKLMARDALKQNMVNLRTSLVTPITATAWDRNSQMAQRVSHTKARWAFTKADRRSAYKKLLLDQEQVNLTLVALRNPISGRWSRSSIGNRYLGRLQIFYIITAMRVFLPYARIKS